MSALEVLALGALGGGAVAPSLDLRRRLGRRPVHETVCMLLVDVERRTAAVLTPEQPFLARFRAEPAVVLLVEVSKYLESLRLEHDVSR